MFLWVTWRFCFEWKADFKVTLKLLICVFLTLSKKPLYNRAQPAALGFMDNELVRSINFILFPKLGFIPRTELIDSSGSLNGNNKKVENICKFQPSFYYGKCAFKIFSTTYSNCNIKFQSKIFFTFRIKTRLYFYYFSCYIITKMWTILWLLSLSLMLQDSESGSEYPLGPGTSGANSV